ncbi:MAG: hypothetical protein WC900_10775 [Oscillospiraceae bacterium]
MSEFTPTFVGVFLNKLTSLNKSQIKELNEDKSDGYVDPKSSIGFICSLMKQW